MLSRERDRPPSAAHLAERALIGALAWVPERLHDLRGWLHPSDFDSFVDGRIFEVVSAMVEQDRTDRLVAELPEALARGLYANSIGPEPRHPMVDWMLRVHERLAATPASPPPRSDDHVSGTGGAEGVAVDHREHSEHVRYAQMVIEASTRRAVLNLGCQIEQVAENALSDLERAPAVLRETLAAATARLTELADRLHSTGRRPIVDALRDPGQRSRITGRFDVGSSGLPELASTLSPRQLRHAELEALTGALTVPHLRSSLIGRLEPKDLTDPRIAATWSAIIDLHNRGEPIDYVTVAWHGERRTPIAGPPIRLYDLARIGTASPSVETYTGAEIVVTAALIRYARDAGRQVKAAAQARPSGVQDFIDAAHRAVGGADEQARRLHPPAGTTRVGSEGEVGPAPVVPTPRGPGSVTFGLAALDRESGRRR